MRKKITSTDTDEVRPISARALKSAIDTLRPYLPHSEVLDVFAGQGRLGISALEEGALSAHFVEKNRTTAKALEKELQKRGYTHKVFATDALEFLKKPSQTYDIVFADPPFPLWNTPTFSETLFSLLTPHLNDPGILLLKYPHEILAQRPISGLKLWKETRFGESVLIYYEKSDLPWNL